MRHWDVNHYMQSIGEYNPLTANQEVELANRVAEGDMEAREMLVSHNLKLVVHIVKRHFQRTTDAPEDLISYGNLGLIRAVETFDIAFGVRFATYASYWIKQSISHSIRNYGYTVRVPQYMAEIIGCYDKAVDKLSRKTDEPTDQEIMAEMRRITKAKLTADTLERVRRTKALTPRPDGHTVIDSKETDESDAFYAENCEAIRKAIDSLDAKEAAVIRMRFLDDMTLEEVGRKFNVCKERVRQIEAIALRGLRNWFIARGIN